MFKVFNQVDILVKFMIHLSGQGWWSWKNENVFFAIFFIGDANIFWTDKLSLDFEHLFHRKYMLTPSIWLSL